MFSREIFLVKVTGLSEVGDMQSSGSDGDDTGDKENDDDNMGN